MDENRLAHSNFDGRKIKNRSLNILRLYSKLTRFSLTNKLHYTDQRIKLSLFSWICLRSVTLLKLRLSMAVPLMSMFASQTAAEMLLPFLWLFMPLQLKQVQMQYFNAEEKHGRAIETH